MNRPNNRFSSFPSFCCYCCTRKLISFSFLFIGSMKTIGGWLDGIDPPPHSTPHTQWNCIYIWFTLFLLAISWTKKKRWAIQTCKQAASVEVPDIITSCITINYIITQVVTLAFRALEMDLLVQAIIIILTLPNSVSDSDSFLIRRIWARNLYRLSRRLARPMVLWAKAYQAVYSIWAALATVVVLLLGTCTAKDCLLVSSMSELRLLWVSVSALVLDWVSVSPHLRHQLFLPMEHLPESMEQVLVVCSTDRGNRRIIPTVLTVETRQHFSNWAEWWPFLRHPAAAVSPNSNCCLLHRWAVLNCHRSSRNSNILTPHLRVLRPSQWRLWPNRLLLPTTMDSSIITTTTTIRVTTTTSPRLMAAVAVVDTQSFQLPSIRMFVRKWTDQLSWLLNHLQVIREPLFITHSRQRLIITTLRFRLLIQFPATSNNNTNSSNNINIFIWCNNSSIVIRTAHRPLLNSKWTIHALHFRLRIRCPDRYALKRTAGKRRSGSTAPHHWNLQVATHQTLKSRAYRAQPVVSSTQQPQWLRPTGRDPTILAIWVVVRSNRRRSANGAVSALVACVRTIVPLAPPAVTTRATRSARCDAARNSPRRRSRWVFLLLLLLRLHLLLRLRSKRRLSRLKPLNILPSQSQRG